MYAYKCRDKNYQSIKELICDGLVIKRGRNLDPYFAPIFCLYAAEAFRREHAEGVWTWDTVFKPLGIPAPDQPVIGEWVETGLAWWQRPLLRDRNKHRRFLVTIACEGGLPLRLVHQEGAHLRRFFIAVLEDYHRQGQGGPDAAEAIAGLLALKFLPAVLCREVVFRLSGELVAKVTELRQSVGDAANPIAVLDSKNPKWRNELPLSIEDQTVERLLGRWGELDKIARSGVRWRGWFTWSETGGKVGKTLEFPDRLGADPIKRLIGLAELPARLRLVLHTSHGTETVARLTHGGGLGDKTFFRREWLRRGGLDLQGTAVVGAHRLVLHDERAEHEISIQGGDLWGEPPWVFIARNGSERLEWLAEGSTKTRAEEAWVLAGYGDEPQPFTGASCDFLGEIAGIKRKVYRIVGGADFVTSDQGRYRIECRAETEADIQYVIRGERISEALNETQVYRGLPRIEPVDSQGRVLPQTAMLQQWKPIGIPSEWQSSAVETAGLLWLRCLDPKTGAECCRRQVAVVPRRFGLRRVIGQTDSPGSYHLTGLEGGRVQVIAPQEARLESAPDVVGFHIQCPTLSSAALPMLRLDILWNGSARVELQLPYPQRGASFRLGGRTLEEWEEVSLDRLGGLRLLLQDHSGSSRFWLNAQLIGGKPESSPYVAGFREQLPMLSDGRLDLGLYAWYDRVASLLASRPDIDAVVRIEIVSSHRETLASIRIARFDLAFKTDKELAWVYLPPEALPRLEPGWEDRVRLEMIRLWAPTSDAVVLEANPERPGVWLIPEGLESGPWWVIGREGGWARFRPLLWTVRSDSESPADRPESSACDFSLAQIIRLAPQIRNQWLPAILAGLGQSPDHCDWPLMSSYFKLAGEFPPSALDVLVRLTEYPDTLAMALLKADEESFERIWALAEAMPFSWGLLPVRTWERAAVRYFHGLLAALAGIPTAEDIVFGLFQSFCERTTLRRAYWRPLCDWLQERVFPTRPMPPNSELSMARRAAVYLEAQIDEAQRELLSRHDGVEDWPANAQIRAIAAEIVFPYASKFLRLPESFQAVHFAPFVVAHLSLKGAKPSQRLIYELRLLRHFDSEWFDTAYAMALTLGLANLRPEKTA